MRALKLSLYCSVLFLIAACGGGGSSAPDGGTCETRQVTSGTLVSYSCAEGELRSTCEDVGDENNGFDDHWHGSSTSCADLGYTERVDDLSSELIEIFYSPDGSAVAGANGVFAEAAVSGLDIEGHAVAAPIASATVKLFQLKEIGEVDDEVLFTTSTDVNGEFTLDMGGLEGDFVVEVSGGSYVDEATGATRDNLTLRGVLFDVEEGDGPPLVAVTPLTELAFRIAESTRSLRPEDLRITLGHAGILAGGLDIATTRPQVLTSSDSASRDELEYGAALAALSQLMADKGYGSVGEALTALVADFDDDQLDGLGQDFIDAFEDFIESASNQSSFETSESTIPSTVSRSMQVISPIDNLSVVDCDRVACSAPNVSGPVLSSDVAKPYPEFCDKNIEGDCAVGDYLSCYGNTCLTFSEPPTDGSNWYNDVCQWFWDFDFFTPSLCPDGRGLLNARELALEGCTSPSSTERNNGSCPLDARITLVVPSDTNLKGALFVHSDGRKLVTGGANAFHPFRDRRLVSDYSAYIEADCSQVGADENCYNLMDVYLHPGVIDAGTTTFSFLTTYGYEWDISATVNDGEHMICNIMNGQCAAKINTGAEGEVKATLTWQTAGADLDLHLIDPCGQEIYFPISNSSQTCEGLTGALDIDDLGNGNLVENIAYAGGAPAGDYTVIVDNFSSVSTVSYTLKIIYGSEVDIYYGSIERLGADDSYSFTLE